MVEETDNILDDLLQFPDMHLQEEKLVLLQLKGQVREDKIKVVTVWQEKYLNIKVTL
jgi:hypothetical protein